MSSRVAAVDCGTNTIKLLVADLDSASGRQQTLVREARMVRLGEGVDRTGRLSEAALSRVFAAVDEYAALIESHAVAHLRFCATSAARDARNGEVFAAGVQTRLGVAPDVLTGEEEARLAFDGATRGRAGDPSQPRSLPGPVLVVDIGGGSTELVLGEVGEGVQAACSLDIGAVRLTERHLHTDPPGESELATAVEAIVSALDSAAARRVDLAAAGTVVAVSGTGLTLGAGARGLSLGDPLLDGARVPVASVAHLVDQLTAMTTEQRRALRFMHPGRADVIVAGGLILRAVLHRTDVDEVLVSVGDLLDGIAWSCLR